MHAQLSGRPRRSLLAGWADLAARGDRQGRQAAVPVHGRPQHRHRWAGWAAAVRQVVLVLLLEACWQCVAGTEQVPLGRLQAGMLLLAGRLLSGQNGLSACKRESP